MGEKTSLSKQDIYWINSIPNEQCVLFESIEDIADGTVVSAMVDRVLNTQLLDEVVVVDGGNIRIKKALSHIVKTYAGVVQLPFAIRDEAAAAQKLIDGDIDTFSALVGFLREQSTSHRIHIRGDSDIAAKATGKENSHPNTVGTTTTEKQQPMPRQNSSSSSSFSTSTQQRKHLRIEEPNQVRRNSSVSISSCQRREHNSLSSSSTLTMTTAAAAASPLHGLAERINNRFKGKTTSSSTSGGIQRESKAVVFHRNIDTTTSPQKVSLLQTNRNTMMPSIATRVAALPVPASVPSSSLSVSARSGAGSYPAAASTCDSQRLRQIISSTADIHVRPRPSSEVTATGYLRSRRPGNIASAPVLSSMRRPEEEEGAMENRRQGRGRGHSTVATAATTAATTAGTTAVISRVNNNRAAAAACRVMPKRSLSPSITLTPAVAAASTVSSGNRAATVPCVRRASSGSVSGTSISGIINSDRHRYHQQHNHHQQQQQEQDRSTSNRSSVATDRRRSSTSKSRSRSRSPNSIRHDSCIATNAFPTAPHAGSSTTSYTSTHGTAVPAGQSLRAVQLPSSSSSAAAAAAGANAAATVTTNVNDVRSSLGSWAGSIADSYMIPGLSRSEARRSTIFQVAADVSVQRKLAAWVSSLGVRAQPPPVPPPVLEVEGVADDTATPAIAAAVRGLSRSRSRSRGGAIDEEVSSRERAFKNARTISSSSKPKNPSSASDSRSGSRENRSTSVTASGTAAATAVATATVSNHLMLSDEWRNGIMLSELCAALTSGRRDNVKEIADSGPHGEHLPSRHVLVGTETHVRSHAQALRNITLAMDALQGLPYHGLRTLADDLDFGPEQVLGTSSSTASKETAGSTAAAAAVTIWAVLLLVHRSLKRSRSRSRGGSRDRSGTPPSHSGTPPSHSRERERMDTLTHTSSHHRGRQPRSRSSSFGKYDNRRSKTHPVNNASCARTAQPQPQRRSRSQSAPPTTTITTITTGTGARRPVPVVLQSQVDSSIGGLSRDYRSHTTGHPSKSSTTSRSQHQLQQQRPGIGVTITGVQAQDHDAHNDVYPWGKTVHFGPLEKDIVPRRSRSVSPNTQSPSNTNPNAHNDIHTHARNNSPATARPGDLQQLLSQQLPTGFQGSFNDGENSTGTSRVRRRKQQRAQLGAWLPAGALKFNINLLSVPFHEDIFTSDYAAHKLPDWMTNAHITDVTHWLLSLGISVKNGEGGESSNAVVAAALSRLGGSSSSGGNIAAPPPVSLQQDRLRNGEILCDLLLLLEPDAASHSHLAKLVHRRPLTLVAAVENVARAQWLFKLRRCPPIPAIYLDRVEGILRGDKQLLWGLLWELRSVYAASNVPSSPPRRPPKSRTAHAATRVGFAVSGTDTGTGPSPDNGHGFGAPYLNSYESPSSSYAGDKSPAPPAAPAAAAAAASPAAVVTTLSPLLPYTAQERRALEISLIHWLQDLGVLHGLDNRVFLADALTEGQHTVRYSSSSSSSPHRHRPPSRSRSPTASKYAAYGGVRAGGDHDSPSSLLVYEEVIRDGSLLCAVALSVLYLCSRRDRDEDDDDDEDEERLSTFERSIRWLGTKSNETGTITAPMASTTGLSIDPTLWSLWRGLRTHPRQFPQQVRNMQRALDSLRRCLSMGTRFLNPGIEEEIVRGDWVSILGLIEDMHRCADGVRPRPKHHNATHHLSSSSSVVEEENGGAGAVAASKSERRERPYLGRGSATLMLLAAGGSSSSSSPSSIYHPTTPTYGSPLVVSPKGVMSTPTTAAAHQVHVTQDREYYDYDNDRKEEERYAGVLNDTLMALAGDVSVSLYSDTVESSASVADTLSDSLQSPPLIPQSDRDKSNDNQLSLAAALSVSEENRHRLQGKFASSLPQTHSPDHRATYHSRTLPIPTAFSSASRPVGAPSASAATVKVSTATPHTPNNDATATDTSHHRQSSLPSSMVTPIDGDRPHHQPLSLSSMKTPKDEDVLNEVDAILQSIRSQHTRLATEGWSSPVRNGASPSGDIYPRTASTPTTTSSQQSVSMDADSLAYNDHQLYATTARPKTTITTTATETKEVVPEASSAVPVSVSVSANVPIPSSCSTSIISLSTSSSSRTRTRDAALILAWFRSLGLTLREPEALLSQNTLKEFTDGALLCKLVQVLERYHGRGAAPFSSLTATTATTGGGGYRSSGSSSGSSSATLTLGSGGGRLSDNRRGDTILAVVEEQERRPMITVSRAQKVANIRRALDAIASRNPRVPLSTLLSRDTENAILCGDASAIMQVLGIIRKAYNICK